jgi:hypothetical protein
MAYIGNTYADRSSGSRPRDDFIGDGTQSTFVLSQGVPGGYESSIRVVVDNVQQEPIEAYKIVRLLRLTIINQLNDFVKNDILTQTGSGATGTIVNAPYNAGYVDVIETSVADFVASNTRVDGAIDGIGYVSNIQLLDGYGLQFTSVPESGAVIYIIHDGGETYQLQPAAGSVTPESLSENLRNFVVDKFTATASQTDFILSQTEISANSLLVIIDGEVKTAIDDYTLSNNGATVTLTTGALVGAKVVVIHLGFSTVSRHAIQEVGDFTPSLKLGGNSVNLSYSNRTGNYIKTGNLVNANISIRLVQIGTSNGVLTLQGLPYLSYGSSIQNCTILIEDCQQLGGTPIAKLPVDSTTLQLGYINFSSGLWEQFTESILNNSTSISINFTYTAAK